MLLHLLVAVFSVSLTCTVILVDDGLLRTSTGCAGPSSSSTLNVVCSNVTVTATEFHIKITIQHTAVYKMIIICDWACENRACGHKLHPITLQVIS